MAETYLYAIPIKLPKEAISEIGQLKSEKVRRQSGEISVLNKETRAEVLFDVGEMDYEEKHELDLAIRRILKRHRVKYSFSNPGRAKLNLYY